MLTVGEILRTQREKKGLSFEQVEEETKIQQKYLQAVEQNNWSVFSSQVYITGILRAYAQFLEVNPEKALAYFRREYDKKERHLDFKQKLSSLGFLPESKKIMIGISVLLCILFGSYFIYQFVQYFSPPQVRILSPQQDSFLNVERITLVGETEPEAEVYILDNEVFLDENGVFEFDIPLEKGTNTVDIKIIGANGQETILEKTYIRE